MKHHAVFYGRIVTVYYKFRHIPYGEIVSYPMCLDKEVIWEGDIDLPLIKENETVYIPSLDTNTNVTKRVRDLRGGYIYYTDYVAKEIIDEKSKADAEKMEEEHRKQVVQSTKDSSDLKKWYQFWK